ncbi:MAG: ATP-binding protein [Candidatus Muiribacteriota bacterium]
MPKRKIISINQDLCNGCGLCTDGCPEGAIQLIDGKARLVNEIFCDGLGECIGSCPVNAISVEEREAAPYDEYKTMENIVKHGQNTVKAHLKHLLYHGQVKYYNQGIEYLKKNNMNVPEIKTKGNSVDKCGCPSAKEQTINKNTGNKSADIYSNIDSQLTSWPVQLTLVSPMGGFFESAELLIAADCTAFSYGNFHNRFMKGKVPIIFCPKLDKNYEIYVDKLTMIFKENNIKSITIIRMEVPCCGGTTAIVEEALKKSSKNIIVKEYIIGINGEIK